MENFRAGCHELPDFFWPLFLLDSGLLDHLPPFRQVGLDQRGVLLRCAALDLDPGRFELGAHVQQLQCVSGRGVRPLLRHVFRMQTSPPKSALCRAPTSAMPLRHQFHRAGLRVPFFYRHVGAPPIVPSLPLDPAGLHDRYRPLAR